jgi:hypothetical protein
MSYHPSILLSPDHPLESWPPSQSVNGNAFCVIAWWITAQNFMKVSSKKIPHLKNRYKWLSRAYCLHIIPLKDSTIVRKIVYTPLVSGHSDVIRTFHSGSMLLLESLNPVDLSNRLSLVLTQKVRYSSIDWFKLRIGISNAYAWSFTG